jgi:predicted ATPase/DNA-binding SARP family transcriptional activator
MLVINLLGDFKVQIDRQPVEISSRPARTLLAFLLLNRAAVQSRERIAGLFWPDVLESSARQNLRSAIYTLSKAIGKEYLIVDHGSIGFNADAPHQLDIDRLTAGSGADLDSLIESVSVYQGELLAGFDEDWVMLERERLRSVYELHMQTLLDHLAAAERWEEMITWAERWISFGYIPEPAFRALMIAHAGRSDMAAMASAYRRCIESLQTYLDVPPSHETEQLFRQLSQKAAAQPAPSAQPVVVSQPSLAPASASGAHAGAHTLPEMGTSFVGREKEVQEIRQLLTVEPECRLLTLTGPGGIGKTRLSVEAVSSIDFPDGVWFLPLVSVQDVEALVNRLTKMLGVLHGDTESPEFCLFQFLKECRLLLVLDNFEHLLPQHPSQHAPHGAASFVSELVRQNPGVKVLITSRERLNLRSEWIYPISGLQIEQAVQLFLQRARQVRRGGLSGDQDVEAAWRICEMVGGLPLAVELAAAWANVLTYEQIAAEIQQGLEILSTQLSDVPSRHQKMEVIFDASWSRLEHEEKLFFRRLAVFEGSFNRQAAEQIVIAQGRTGPPSQSPSTQAIVFLAKLVEKSFLQQIASDRYKLHELFRQYSLRRLAESDEEERVRDLHARYYLARLASFEPVLKKSDQHQVLDQITEDYDNFLAGWYCAANNGLIDLMTEAIEVLWLYFSMRRYSLELHKLMQQTLLNLQESPAGMQDPDKRDTLESLVTALSGGAQMLAGNYHSAQELLQRALAVLDKQAAKRWFALVNNWMASNHLALGNFQESWNLLCHSIEICEKENDRWLLAYCLNDLGLVSALLGQTERARRNSLRSLHIFQSIDDRRGTAFVFSNLGLYASQAGDYPKALEYYHESLRLREQNRDQLGQAQVHLRLGAALSASGDMENAQQHLLKALQTVYTMQFSGILVETVVEFAFIFFESGEASYARKILAMCLAHPSISREVSEQSKKRYEALYPADPLPQPEPLSLSAFEKTVQQLLNVAKN